MENKEQLVDLLREGFRTQLKDPCGSCIPLDSATWFGAILSIPTNQMIKQSINQIHYYLYWSRMRTPWVGRTILREALQLCGVGSSRLFFTNDLHPALSWASQGLSLKAPRSPLTHSDHVFLGLPGPLLPAMDIDLTLLISPEDRLTCPNHLSLPLLTRMTRTIKSKLLVELLIIRFISGPDCK